MGLALRLITIGFIEFEEHFFKKILEDRLQHNRFDSFRE